MVTTSCFVRLQSLSGHQSAVESIAFDPSERKVVAGSKAGSIKAFDLEAAKMSRSLKGHMSTCTTVDYHLYGDYVASGSLDTIVKVRAASVRNPTAAVVIE